MQHNKNYQALLVAATTMFFACLLLVATAIANIANAQPATMELGVYTAHLVSDRESANENNQFFSIAYGGWQAGTFINSLDDRSYALGYRADVTPWLGISAGGILGYERKTDDTRWWVGDWLLYVAPDVQVLARDTIGLRVRVFGEVVSVVGVIKL